MGDPCSSKKVDEREKKGSRWLQLRRTMPFPLKETKFFIEVGRISIKFCRFWLKRYVVQIMLSES